MSRHYSGGGRLVAIECDRCGKLIAPNPNIAESGWMKCGIVDPVHGRLDWDYCDAHSDIAERIGRSRITPPRAGEG